MMTGEQVVELVKFVVGSILAGIAPFLMALAAYRESRRTTDKVAEVSEKATEIHTLTNGNLHLVESRLIAATEKINGLEKLIASLAEHKQEAKEVAKAVKEDAERKDAEP